MFLVYNSDILTEDDCQLPINDRAFQYGDGLFETIRYEKNHLWFWSDHMDRLFSGMSAFRFQVPSTVNELILQEQVHQLLSLNKLTNQPVRIKIQVWRQPGGLYTPATQAINYLITVRAGQPFQVTNQTKLGIYDAFRLYTSPVSAYKTLNALPYIFAGLFRQEHGFADVALLSTEGYLTECVASNLFWFQNDTLYTPSLQTGCINGIARRQLLHHFPVVQEGLFLPAALSNADLVFAANVMGVQVFSGGWSGTQFDQVRQIFMDLSV